jgi:hypothetical protein
MSIDFFSRYLFLSLHFHSTHAPRFSFAIQDSKNYTRFLFSIVQSSALAKAVGQIVVICVY